MPGPSAAALDLAWSYARGATWKHGDRHGVLNIATGGLMFLNHAGSALKSIDPDPACFPHSSKQRVDSFFNISIVV